MLYLCWTHGIPLVIQHFPAWHLQSQTLVARKMFAAVEVPQFFVVTMSQHGHILATNTAIEMAGFCRNIRGPSHKKLPNITSYSAFFILYVVSDRNRRRGSPMLLSLPLLRLSIPDCSNTAHDVNKTIIVISFSCQMTCSTLLTTQMIRKLSDALLAFLHSRRHSRYNAKIWG